MIGRWAVWKREAAVILGALFTLIAFGTSWVLFSQSQFVSIGTLLITIIISMPVTAKLLKQEAQRVRECTHFWHTHEPIVDFLLYFFIGVFVASFLLALVFPGKIFSAHDLYGSQVLSSPDLWLLLRNNIIVMVVSFALSVFYGSGVLFLIVLNANLFASGLAAAARQVIPQQLGFLGNYAFIACNMGVLLFHGVPELASYIFAAVAGSLLAKAFEPNIQFSEHFYRLLKDAGKIVLYALGALLVGVLIESLVSANLAASGICVKQPVTVLAIALVLIIVLVLIEQTRKNK